MTYLFTYLFRMKRWDRSRLFKWQRKSRPESQPTSEPKPKETVKTIRSLMSLPPTHLTLFFFFFKGLYLERCGCLRLLDRLFLPSRTRARTTFHVSFVSCNL